VVLWFIALVIVTLVHRQIPVARWLMIHLLLLGAVTHAIFVFSRHFTDAVLHARPTARRWQSLRLGLVNAGAATVMVGMIGAWWPVVLVGGVVVGGAVLWHGAVLFGLLRGALASRFGAIVRYYIAAAALFPVGITVGIILARTDADPWHSRLVAAHALTNLLGWVGLTVLGTLVTLWPTMLRTRIVAGAERAARWALPLLLLGVAFCLLASLSGPVGPPWGVAVGLAVYLAGIVTTALPLVREAVAAPPMRFAPLSVAAGVVWLVGCLVASMIVFATSGTWEEAGTRFGWLTPALAAGFAAQVLLGALSHLLPVLLGGGPRAVKAGEAEFSRLGPARVAVVNLGILVALLPVPSWVRVVDTVLVLGAFVLFLPFLFRGLIASRRAKREAAAPASAPQTTGPAGPEAGAAAPASTGATPEAPGRSVAASTRAPVHGVAASTAGSASVLRQVLAGVAVVALGVVAGVAIDPAAASLVHSGAAAGVTPTGEVTRVSVDAKDMRFTPSTIEVPAGNRLVIRVHNTDASQVHDLVLESGQSSGRLAPGESATVDAGVVGRSLDAWCSVAGHRQMGMTMRIVATGAGAADVADGSGTDGSVGSGNSHDMAGMPGMEGHDGADSDSSDSAANALDFMATPGKDFTAADASLPSAKESASGHTVHRRTFKVTEMDREVAPGVRQKQWVYEGSAPGPTLRGKVGDTFVITLVNDATMGHSIDFHAGELAPDQPMRTIAPGQRLTYTFKATHAGVWLYHCSTMPMSLHLANGMFGAVIIDPPGLKAVDAEYVLVQSELYLGAQDQPADEAKVQAQTPDAVVFNGYVNQYRDRPLTASVGDRVRIWVLDAGLSRDSVFHVVGGQFDTVYKEGSYLLKPSKQQGGSQALELAPAQGGFVELTFHEAGNYPFLTHRMVDAEHGASGIIKVTGH